MLTGQRAAAWQAPDLLQPLACTASSVRKHKPTPSGAQKEKFVLAMGIQGCVATSMQPVDKDTCTLGLL